MGALGEVVTAVEHRHFKNEDLLFSDGAGELADLRGYLRAVVVLFNASEAARHDVYAQLLTAVQGDGPAEDPRAGLTLGFDAVLETQAERVAAGLEALTDLARMEALSFVGDRQGARAMLSRQLARASGSLGVGDEAA